MPVFVSMSVYSAGDVDVVFSQHVVEPRVHVGGIVFGVVVRVKPLVLAHDAANWIPYDAEGCGVLVGVVLSVEPGWYVPIVVHVLRLGLRQRDVVFKVISAPQNTLSRTQFLDGGACCFGDVDEAQA
eukprot:7799438-Pyramimonas_sp.AAC.2